MAINDVKWEILFERYDIVKAVAQNGYFDITAEQIKSVREPRLMCKMDFKEQIPKSFAKHNLSILAISNGKYRIAETTPFFEIDLAKLSYIHPEELELPTNIETIQVDNITSESQALDAAVASGMIDKILGEPSYLTVRGRRYSNSFELELFNDSKSNKVIYPVKSVQIEVDGGYEGKTVLALIEAKMGTSSNMNMRQLVYPHKHFEAILSKKVTSFVLFYETGSLFSFIPMSIRNQECYLDYENAVRFRLKQNSKSHLTRTILEIPSPGNGAPFPQADDFSKVLYGYFKIAEKPGTEADIFSELQISPRQYNYYFNAIKWLGLADKEKRGRPIGLSMFGRKLLGIPEKERMKILRKVIRKNEVVIFIETNPDSPLPVTLKQKYGMEGPSMFPRRKQTIESWLKFFEEYFSMPA